MTTWQRMSADEFRRQYSFLEYLTNSYDPEKPNATRYVAIATGETSDEAWQRNLDFLAGKVIGPPRATETYSVTELAGFGMVGVYRWAQ